VTGISDSERKRQPSEAAQVVALGLLHGLHEHPALPCPTARPPGRATGTYAKL